MKEVEMEVEDPEANEKKRQAEQELLLIQRQYQGSVDQRNFEELEIDMKGRSGSIVIKQQEGKATAQKKVEGTNGEGAGFFSKMSNFFCGTKPATDPKP